MTKAELIEHVQQADGVPDLTKKSTAAIVEAVFDAMKFALTSPQKDAERRFSYPGFGTFKAKKRRARTGHNPKTREPITVAARMTVSFKAAPSFRKDIPLN